MHLTEDELVLHYYGELTASDEARAATHLTSCATCHDNLRQLQRVLAVVDESALAGPELPEHFERTVWARLEPNLQRAARRVVRPGSCCRPAASPGLRPSSCSSAPRSWPDVCCRDRRTARRTPPTICASGSCSSISATISIARRWCSSSSSAPTMRTPWTSRASAPAPSSWCRQPPVSADRARHWRPRHRRSARRARTRARGSRGQSGGVSPEQLNEVRQRIESQEPALQSSRRVVRRAAAAEVHRPIESATALVSMDARESARRSRERDRGTSHEAHIVDFVRRRPGDRRAGRSTSLSRAALPAPVCGARHASGDRAAAADGAAMPVDQGPIGPGPMGLGPMGPGPVGPGPIGPGPDAA